MLFKTTSFAALLVAQASAAAWSGSTAPVFDSDANTLATTSMYYQFNQDGRNLSTIHKRTYTLAEGKTFALKDFASLTSSYQGYTAAPRDLDYINVSATYTADSTDASSGIIFVNIGIQVDA
mmetsp:Transcript_30768/g.38072  ORF Transcript_30768/g.38072 Transcript_30768/m.38072 type:complete len:122 (-) Transcript_30768:513-878(-)